MIIVKTPFRISFFGGGTDLPAFSSKYGGAVIGTSINKYIYHSILKFPSELFQYSIRFSYSKVECAKSIDFIEHKPFKEILKQYEISKDLEVNIAADLPSFSGLGSSSAFTVGLINGLCKHKDLMFTKHKLATEAIRIEQDILKEKVGSQDQVFAAYGGLNRINFHKNGDIKVDNININKTRLDELESSLLIFFTGITRRSQNIEKKKIDNMNNIETNLKKILNMVDEGYNILSGNSSLIRFGELLGKTWEEKKMLDESVSSPAIDGIYKKAIEAGAIGGKLLGAGGGGFLLLFVPQDRKQKVREKLNGYHEISFKFENHGSQVIHN